MVSHDLVFALGWESVEDLAIRGWMRPPDRLLLRALSDESWRHVIVAEPGRHPLAAVRRQPRGRRLPLPPTHVAAGRTLVSPTIPVTSRSGGRVQVRLRYRAVIRAVLQAAEADGHASPTLLSTDPILTAKAADAWPGCVAYYARDDWAVHPAYAPLHAAIREAYARIRGRRIPVVAVSDALLARLGPAGASLHLPNGIESKEWIGPPQRAAGLESLPRPRVTYAGSVDSRLDVDWVRELASDTTVVVAGPVMEPGIADELRAIPGVALTGHLGRRDIVAVIRASDVCVIPHVRTPLTGVMDPLKLYEYLAAGKPVVAADLPGNRGHGSRVELVGSRSERANALRRALARGDADPEERTAFVRTNSWDRRYAQLTEFLWSLSQ